MIGLELKVLRASLNKCIMIVLTQRYACTADALCGIEQGYLKVGGGGVPTVSLVTFRWSDNLNMMRFMNFTIIFSQFELGNFGMHTVEVIQTTEAYSGSFSP